MAEYLLYPDKNPDERFPEPFVTLGQIENHFRQNRSRGAALGHVNASDGSGLDHGPAMIGFIANVAHPAADDELKTRLRDKEAAAVNLAHNNIIEQRPRRRKDIDLLTTRLHNEARQSRDRFPFLAAAFATQGALDAADLDAGWLVRRITAAAQ